MIESKSFRTKIRHANGGWERLNFNRWEGIASPVDQNDRHILVLKELLKDRGFVPSRFGLAPRFHNIVVVQPSCSIVGSIPDDARVYRMDNLVKKVVAVDLSPFDLLKAISQESLHAFARALVDCHRPLKYRPVTTLPKTGPSQAQTGSGAHHRCQGCDGPVSGAEANYCRKNATRFSGKLLCRTCQEYLPKEPTRQKRLQTSRCTGETIDEKILKIPVCARCGREVEQKVVKFCRFESKRFGGRILCRVCQWPGSSGGWQPLGAYP